MCVSRNNADANAESFHIIGHSLGAQIAGIAGKLTPHLRRITSLDAAAPVFQILPKYLKLAQGDAKFIDTIHTNGQISPSKGFGLLEPYGGKDFYPNGGRKQPGCEDGKVFSDADGRNIIVNAMTEVACHHNRAPKLFLASINNTQCRFLSTLCTSYEDFLNGSCYSSPLAEMGLHAKPMDKEGKFYLKTTDQYPYCIPMD
ncbi:hypothetical protein JTE90_015297 [Oedothorax gibbosus]|uniref:Lipase domain-containing protein n=1 Tax=Oedothorax gibbosus TaxID=931172 RepID=A0AAV6VNT1_9ARAC|nr:hypothetical protein JTE90_015297 [Oedothorax gibbosus]